MKLILLTDQTDARTNLAAGLTVRRLPRVGNDLSPDQRQGEQLIITEDTRCGSALQMQVEKVNPFLQDARYVVCRVLDLVKLDGMRD